MKVLGIIAEYNPFHNGHLYHLMEAKKKVRPDYTIVVMSGSFTEQGNAGIYNKFERASIVIENGVDLVIELPTIYSISSSENFAKGAVRVLNDLGIVTHIAFGSECKKLSTLKNVSKKYITFKENIIQRTKENMKSGIPVALARDIALKAILNNMEYNEISSSNNILAIEYLVALSELKSNIQPVLIERRGVGHTESKIASDSVFTSATSIRAILKDLVGRKNNTYTLNDFEKLRTFVPENTFVLINSVPPIDNEQLFNILKYEILKLGTLGIKNIQDVSEGLENRIYSVVTKVNSYESLVEKIKSKRYSLGRIKRILLYILLGITKEKYKHLNGVSYIRILKINSSKKPLLSIVAKKSSVPIISKISDDNFKDLKNNVRESLKLDIFASDILNLYKKTTGSDYYNQIIQD